jgi:hypothetical protein
MRTERIAIAYRLLFAYPFVRPESEQNSSHLQIDCDRVVGNRDSMFRHSVTHDLLSKAEDDRSPGDFHSTGASYVPRMDGRGTKPARATP